MEHKYQLKLNWTGGSEIDAIQNDRMYEVLIDRKPTIYGSADKPFFGDPEKYNPEDLLLAALSACHMMSFMYVCRKLGIKVYHYEDHATGLLKINQDGTGQFEFAELKPKVKADHMPDGMIFKELNSRAAKLCFIKRSINFTVNYKGSFESL